MGKGRGDMTQSIAPFGSAASVAVPGTPRGIQARIDFESAVLSVAGEAALLWLPRSTETTTTTDRSLNARVFTENATMNGRFLTQGSGVGVTYNGSSDYATTPDVDGLSFGNGQVDSPMSIVAVVNFTNFTAAQTVMSKATTSTAGEWRLTVSTGGLPSMHLIDNSATARIGMAKTSGSIGAGAIVNIGASYDGSGSSSGIALYNAGARVAISTDNSGTYTAMENLTNVVAFGADTGPANYFVGSAYFGLLCGKALSQEEMWYLKTLINGYFSLSL